MLSDKERLALSDICEAVYLTRQFIELELQHLKDDR